MIFNRKYTRRAWIGVAAGVGVGGAALGWLLPVIRRKAIESLYYGGSPTGRPASTAELRVVAHFTGALMGRRLDDAQIDLLVRRLAIARRHRGSQYTALAEFADREARRLDPQVKSFADASDSVRDRIIQQTMSEPAPTRVARVALLAFPGNRSRLRIRHGTAPHLRFLYARTQIPWKIRGYKGAPGAPADRLEYTRPGPTRFG